MGERSDVYGVLVGTSDKKKTNWKNQGVDRSIILKWIDRKWDVGVLTGSSRLRIGRGDGHF
jgi:hypothetical protein